MRSNTSILDLLNIFSITVVAGTLGGAVFFTKAFQVQMPWYWWWTLPSTVWVIYTLDHLFDGMKVKEQAQTIRHQMHYKYRKLIFWLAGIIGVINIYLVAFYFDKELIEFGVVLSACVGLYLLIYQLFNRSSKKSYLKELVVAAIYVIGIAGGPLVMADIGLTKEVVVSLSLYFVAAICNLFIFSLFDYQKDKLNNFSSLARSIGFKTVHITAVILLVLSILFLSIISVGNYMEASIMNELMDIPIWDRMVWMFVLLSMFIGLTALLAFPKWFAVNERYRFLGDGVFLFPLILLGV